MIHGSSGALLRIAFVSLLFWTLYLIAVIALCRGYGELWQMRSLVKEMVSQDVIARLFTRQGAYRIREAMQAFGDKAPEDASPGD